MLIHPHSAVIQRFQAKPIVALRELPLFQGFSLLFSSSTPNLRINLGLRVVFAHF